MNKEEIQNKLKNKYDEFTTTILSNSILEFQEVFQEKYIKTEEVIEIVITNIPKGIIVYSNLEKNFDAICAISSGEFKVEKDVLEDKDYFSYVFFHEFLHSISYRKHDNMQFMGFFTTDKGEDYEFKSDAFNEVFTEYMTLKRNKMCNYAPKDKFLSGYDVGAHMLDILTKIVPEHELTDSYFNYPNLLEEIFEKYNMNLDEILYSFYTLEGMEYDVKALENKYGLKDPQHLIRIIDGERYLFYNLLDAFGEVQNEEEFNNKWEILLSELNSRYNFFNIDGIFRYGMLCQDIDRLNIQNNELIKKNNLYEKLDKYRLLNNIFIKEDKFSILRELHNIYSEDYNKYWDLLKDEFASLAYAFLENIKNNYQLYDIEIYPRVFPYLEKENVELNEVNFEKVSCEEENIKFYIFKINDNTYVESNYDDTTINKINNNEFEVKYTSHRGLLDLKKGIYEIDGVKYNVKIIY